MEFSYELAFINLKFLDKLLGPDFLWIYVVIFNSSNVHTRHVCVLSYVLIHNER